MRKPVLAAFALSLALILPVAPAIAHDSSDHNDKARFRSHSQSSDRFDTGGTRRLGTGTGRSLGAHSDGLGRLGQGTNSRPLSSHGDNLGSMRHGGTGHSRDHGLGTYRGNGLGAWSGRNLGNTGN